MSIQIPSRVLAPASLSAIAIARTADLGGLAAVVVPYDEFGVDPLVLGAHLLRNTRYVEVFVGLEPWVATPQYAAKVSASLQRFSHGRLGWYFATDSPEVETFLATARSFWASTDGLPTGLSTHPFPQVLRGEVEGLIDVRGEVSEVLRLGEQEGTHV